MMRLGGRCRLVACTVSDRLRAAAKINQGEVRFVDLHLSEVAQMVNYGFFGEIDVAVIEASAIAPDGRVWLTSGIGNAPTWLLWAKKMIIRA